MNVDISASVSEWSNHATDIEIEELERLKANPEQLYDAFYRELSFGTAGLRGILGIGSNRMNVHTVAKATQGFAEYIVAHFENPSLVIARDSRNMGWEFSKTVACVMAANGVKVSLFEDVQPTPVLSFAVRHLGCSGGINITASHNPAQYNGYKAYGPDGCQIASEAAREIQERIDALSFFDDVKSIEFDEGVRSGAIQITGTTVVDAFLDAVEDQSLENGKDEKGSIKVVYTPLNGTGLYCVKSILERIGIDDIHIVSDQEKPNGDFPTCPYPNPEIREALQKGLELCDRVHPDLLLATDPDADRVGIAVPHNGEYHLLSGNEVGALLIDYICAARQNRGESLDDKLVITTIVSSLMPDALAEEYGFELRRVLTGFKYIGGQIALLESMDEQNRFIFGFEESYGYMSGTHVRDKDAINASMLICQMARWHKAQGHDLYEAMERLYDKHGYYLNKTLSLSYPGSAGAQKMDQIMEMLRNDPPSEISNRTIESVTDYIEGAAMPCNRKNPSQTLPSANVVSFNIEEGTKVIFRPSGTEPKIKAYLFARGENKHEAQELLNKLEESAMELLS